MKKKLIRFVLAICCVALLFATAAFAEETDLTAYLQEVVGDTLRAPANVSVGEAVTIASRLHAARSGIDISYYKDVAKDYVPYATRKGILSGLSLGSDYTSPITRSDAVRLFVNAMGNPNFSAKTQEDIIVPDVLEGDKNYDLIISLYRAGILKGVDEYGYFLPDEPLTDVQAAYLITALADEALRTPSVQTETYNESRARYLIDDYYMTLSKNDMIASGWVVEDTAAMDVNQNNAARTVYDGAANINITAPILPDNSATGHINISRDFYEVTSGTMRLEANFKVLNGSDGFRLYFTDGTRDNVYAELFSKDGYIYFTDGIDETRLYSSSSGYLYCSTTYFYIRMDFDIDNGTVQIYNSGADYGVHNINNNITSVSRLYIGTSDEGILSVEPLSVHLHANYAVNETFLTVNALSTAYVYPPSASRPLFGFTKGSTGGSVYTYNLASTTRPTDKLSLCIDGASGNDTYITKSFDEIGGKVVFESYLLMRANYINSAYVTLMGDGKEIARVYTQDNAFWYGDTKLRDYMTDVWQLVRIEADLNTGKVDIKIDGKKVAEGLKVQTWVDHADEIRLGVTASTLRQFFVDDIKVYRLPEYSDYVPEPTPVPSDDYYLVMATCNLWRNGSHYGWDFISPFDELTPYIGYYDEGNTEEMDWEIKYLVEHGIDDYHTCWFSPYGSPDSPIKWPRMGDALTNGYMNAKYSDMIKFSIMWENANDGYDESSSNFANFKNNIWRYWVEWYFTDPRYFTIDNKPVLNIYRTDRFLSKAGGSTTKAKELLDWMREDILNYGQNGTKFDGIIIYFMEDSSNTSSTIAAMGADASAVYGWGELSYDSDWQMSTLSSRYAKSQTNGLDLLGVVSVGRNGIGWAHERDPLASPESYQTTLSYMKNTYLKNYPDSSWKSKFVYFDNWNEYGEGHFLAPTNTHGFAYLDAIKDTFTSSNVSCSNTDTTPTAEQKERFGQLYPATRMPLQRTWLVEDTPVYPTQSTGYVWNMQRGGSLYCDFTYSGTNQLTSVTKTGNSGFTATSSGNDPILIFSNSNLNINASGTRFLHINMRSNAASHIQLFFATDTDPNFSESKSVRTTLYSDDAFHDYYIDLQDNEYWRGTVNKLRLDPVSDAGVKFTIKTFEFVNYTTEQELNLKKITLTTDGYEWNNSPTQITEFDANEIYYALNHEDGFFSLNRLSYDWSRFTGKLGIYSFNGTLLEFTVGSNVCYVNGTATQLDRAVTLLDGMPVIPMLFVFDNAGVDYTYDYSARTLNTDMGRYADPNITPWTFTKSASDAGNSNPMTFYATTSLSYYTNTSSLYLRSVTDTDINSTVWEITNRYNTNSSNYFVAEAHFEPYRSYHLEFDVRIMNNAAGEAVVANSSRGGSRLWAAIQLPAADTSVTYQQFTQADGTHSTDLTTADGWYHFSGDLKVSGNSNLSTSTPTLFFIVAEGQASKGVTYRIDNLELTCTD